MFRLLYIIGLFIFIYVFSSCTNTGQKNMISDLYNYDTGNFSESSYSDGPVNGSSLSQFNRATNKEIKYIKKDGITYKCCKHKKIPCCGKRIRAKKFIKKSLRVFGGISSCTGSIGIWAIQHFIKDSFVKWWGTSWLVVWVCGSCYLVYDPNCSKMFSCF